MGRLVNATLPRVSENDEPTGYAPTPVANPVTPPVNHRFTRGSNSGHGIVLVAAVALLSVIALVQQTWSTWARQAEVTRHMRQGVAEVSARNFVSRLQAILGNDVAFLLDRLARSSESPPTAATVAAALDGCDCRLAPFVSVVLIDGRSRVTWTARRSHEVVPRASIPARVRQGAASEKSPAMWMATPGHIGIYAALPPANDSESQGVALILSVAALREVYAPFVADSTGRLFPGALSRAPASYPSIAISLEASGVEVFATGTAAERGLHVTLPVTVDSQLVARVVAHPLLDVPSPAVPWWQPPLLAVLTLATLLAVVATVLVATRSAQLGRMQGAFAASVSHELRTPLTQIILQAELLERGRVTPEALGDTARLIRAEARRLHQMVENALFVSRSGGTNFTLRLRPVSLAPLVRDVVEGFLPIAAQHDARVLYDLPELADAIADPDAVRQVLLNLLDNALRHGPEGQTLRVALGQGRDVVVLEVDDEGPGIPRALRRLVFEPWRRLDSLSPQPGAGLGLSVVEALVRQMRGQVEIVDAPRAGTRVRVTLPSITLPSA